MKTNLKTVALIYLCFQIGRFYGRAIEMNRIVKKYGYSYPFGHEFCQALIGWGNNPNDTRTMDELMFDLKKVKKTSSPRFDRN